MEVLSVGGWGWDGAGGGLLAREACPFKWKVPGPVRVLITAYVYFGTRGRSPSSALHSLNRVWCMIHFRSGGPLIHLWCFTLFPFAPTVRFDVTVTAALGWNAEIIVALGNCFCSVLWFMAVYWMDVPVESSSGAFFFVLFFPTTPLQYR